LFYQTFSDIVSGENLRAFLAIRKVRRELETLTPPPGHDLFPFLLSMRHVVMDGVHKVFYYWKPDEASFQERRGEITASAFFADCQSFDVFKRALLDQQQRENDSLLSFLESHPEHFRQTTVLACLAKNGELSMQRALISKAADRKGSHLQAMHDSFARVRAMASESLNITYLIHAPMYLAEYHDLMCTLPDANEKEHQAERKQLLERTLFFLGKSPNPIFECASILGILDILLRFDAGNAAEIATWVGATRDIMSAHPQTTAFLQQVSAEVRAAIEVEGEGA